jgi:hypothetical protein
MIDYSGIIPCNAWQEIFILLGILSFHKDFQTGLLSEDPGRDNYTALGPS